MIEVVLPNGATYRRPKASKDAIIADLTFRGLIKNTRFIDLAQERRQQLQAEAFKKNNPTAAQPVVKKINK